MHGYLCTVCMQARDDVTGLLVLVDVAVDGWLLAVRRGSGAPASLLCHADRPTSTSFIYDGYCRLQPLAREDAS